VVKQNSFANFLAKFQKFNVFSFLRINEFQQGFLKKITLQKKILFPTVQVL